MKALRKPLSLFMALLMCLGVFVGTGTTAFAAGETMTTYMIDLPRANDPNKAGWGHPALNFLGGWSTGENDSFSVHTQDAFNGRAIYCIEPGVGVNTGDQYTGRGEDFWDNYPSNLNPTIPPDSPTSGNILFDGKDISQTGLADHRKNHVSFIFQAYNLIDYLTPAENVSLTSKLPPLPILERLGLTKEEAKRNVLKLSGGQQQRVAIARALASEAPVILADEPTGNLDEDTAQDITEILKESAHKMNKCVVVVTHSNELAKQADVVFRLKKGTLTVEVS